jgi:hypothetical protein
MRMLKEEIKKANDERKSEQIAKKLKSMVYPRRYILL